MLYGVFKVWGLKKKDAGRRQKRRRKERKRRGNRKKCKDGRGDETTETNSSPLTAVLHFQRDRHKIEDQKSNKFFKDESWAPTGTHAGIVRHVDWWRQMDVLTLIIVTNSKHFRIPYLGDHARWEKRFACSDWQTHTIATRWKVKWPSGLQARTHFTVFLLLILADNLRLRLVSTRSGFDESLCMEIIPMMLFPLGIHRWVWFCRGGS